MRFASLSLSLCPELRTPGAWPTSKHHQNIIDLHKGELGLRGTRMFPFQQWTNYVCIRFQFIVPTLPPLCEIVASHPRTCQFV